MNSSDESPVVVELPGDAIKALVEAASGIDIAPELLNVIIVGARMSEDVLSMVRTVEDALVAAVRAEAVAAERQRIKATVWTQRGLLADREHTLAVVNRIIDAAGSVPVATPLPDSRLALLGPARMVLDRCAVRENPADPDNTKAGRMAQRIVDAIGHPVTDQHPVSTPPVESAAEQLLRDIFMDPGPVATPPERCTSWVSSNHDDEDVSRCGGPATGEWLSTAGEWQPICARHSEGVPASRLRSLPAHPVATPTEPADEWGAPCSCIGDELGNHDPACEEGQRPIPNTEPQASPVPAEQPDGWGEGVEAADHPVNCGCAPCVIGRLRDSNDSLRDELGRAAEEIDRLSAGQEAEHG